MVAYPDAAAVAGVVGRLRRLPPLVTSFEIEHLRSLLSEAEEGRRFVLQGGDCAEAFEDCTSPRIASTLKVLLQMSLVLVHALRRPVVRVGRFAGQYAKPRTSATETREARGERVTLPSYFGDLINGAEFDARSRAPDPERMIRGYSHAALTLNFVRSLVDGGFADMHHPEYWDLSFLRHASLSESQRREYDAMVGSILDGLGRATEGGRRDEARAEFFTSHEGLNLHYEAAQTRTVPRRAGFYDLTTHFPWIGDRTRRADGAHVEFFRGVRNPLGVKVGPGASASDVLALCTALNPRNEAGRLALIVRLGARHVEERLPALIAAVQGGKRRVLWMCDPMHGNGVVTRSGVKTRAFDDIRHELEASLDVHRRLGTCLGGIHVELTGEDVTECVGGAADVTEADLDFRYASVCDPRLNYQQALELAFVLGRQARARGAEAFVGVRGGRAEVAKGQGR